MTPCSDAPASLAGRPLYETIAALLAFFPERELPETETLSALLQHAAPGTLSAGGKPIRFAPPADMPDGYEQHIFATGDVPTRSNDWHDFFNALAWCVWPHTKARCNRLHIEAMRARADAGLEGRGAVRDTLTQFDECGIVVVSSNAEITALLAGHAWEEALWTRREDLLRSTRFLVIGHGIWDQLRKPFFGLCAKALYRTVDPAWLTLPTAAAQAECDNWLAGHLTQAAANLTPRALSPLPLLGLPGMTPDNEGRDYYLDTRQFRPRRAR